MSVNDVVYRLWRLHPLSSSVIMVHPQAGALPCISVAHAHTDSCHTAISSGQGSVHFAGLNYSPLLDNGPGVVNIRT